MNGLAVGDWLSVATATVSEVALRALGFDAVSFGERSVRIPGGRHGAYVALVADAYTTHVGLVSDQAGCVAMTRAFLGLAPYEVPREVDVVDAVGEIVNIVAGGVKRQLDALEPGIKLGLPLFIHGYIEPSAGMDAASVEVNMGGVEAEVLVIRTPRTSPRHLHPRLV